MNVRLSQIEIQTVITKTLELFSTETSQIYLYGSRTDIHKKGGDIDLWIILHQDQAVTPSQIRQLKNEISHALHEQKVDLKVTGPFIEVKDPTTKAFYEVIKDSMVELWKKN